ncbi:hypothetical protein [Peijinzhouia sedimentorum]
MLSFPQISGLKFKLIQNEKDRTTEATYDKSTETIKTVKSQDFAKGKSNSEILKGTKNLNGLRRLFVHEIQHYVQGLEGFGRGGNLLPSVHEKVKMKNTLCKIGSLRREWQDSNKANK